MRSETIAIHGGYQDDPTTKSVVVPIYQTASYAFESADHGAALFNLEVEGFRYTRINNPTNAVLERRVAELEGGLEALVVASGKAAVNYATIVYTGTISYGLYLLHKIPFDVAQALHLNGNPLVLVLGIGASYALARCPGISWRGQCLG